MKLNNKEKEVSVEDMIKMAQNDISEMESWTDPEKTKRRKENSIKLMRMFEELLDNETL